MHKFLFHNKFIVFLVVISKMARFSEEVIDMKHTATFSTSFTWNFSQPKHRSATYHKPTQAFTSSATSFCPILTNVNFSTDCITNPQQDISWKSYQWRTGMFHANRQTLWSLNITSRLSRTRLKTEDSSLLLLCFADRASRYNHSNWPT